MLELLRTHQSEIMFMLSGVCGMVALAGAIDAKDTYTQGHSSRVAEMKSLNRPGYVQVMLHLIDEDTEYSLREF